ncbi:MAG: DDE-type integrase/transposase/recombinase, partial [Streptococcus sp.]|nr:DDE-type integrase/transposase/recombinase [Streptococcus sp.]
LDLHSRKIIACRLAQLVIKTLKDALSICSVRDQLIFHSDRESQYTSKEYNEFLQKHGIQHFYSAKGCPYDNSCIETFHFTTKKDRSSLKPMLATKMINLVTQAFSQNSC